MMKYICFVTILTLAVTEIKADTNLFEKLNSAAEKCNSTSGVSASDIIKITSGKIEGKAGCFISCIATEFGVLKSDNTFDKAKINKMLEPYIEKAKQENREFTDLLTQAQNIVNGCLDKQTATSDPCISAKSLGECIIDGLKKAGVIP